MQPQGLQPIFNEALVGRQKTSDCETLSFRSTVKNEGLALFQITNFLWYKNFSRDFDLKSLQHTRLQLTTAIIAYADDGQKLPKNLLILLEIIVKIVNNRYWNKTSLETCCL